MTITAIKLEIGKMITALIPAGYFIWTGEMHFATTTFILLLMLDTLTGVIKSTGLFCGGFCYKQGTTGDPTVADSTAYDDGDFGTGAFNKAITGLTAGTSYRVRAYAVNSAGTSYGTTVDVKTLSAFLPRTMWFN